jgi:hypothetical protein
MPKSKAEGPAHPRDPETVAHDLRAQLEAAKRRMRDYRDEMEASGLAQSHDEDEASANDGG